MNSNESILTIGHKLSKYLRWRTVSANEQTNLWFYRDKQELSREFTFDRLSFGGSIENQLTIEARVEPRVSLTIVCDRVRHPVSSERR